MNPNHTGQGAPFDETLPATAPTPQPIKKSDAVNNDDSSQHPRGAQQVPPSAALPSPASAEAGDWADEAAKAISKRTPALIDARFDYREHIASILREHAPQSQSKAEAVGAQKAVEVLEGLKQRWEARRKQLLATGGHSPALEITNVLLELRDEFEFYLNSVAHPPATQNPPENAKGEGK